MNSKTIANLDDSEIIDYLKKGVSRNAIAKIVGVSAEEIDLWCHKNKIPSPQRKGYPKGQAKNVLLLDAEQNKIINWLNDGMTKEEISKKLGCCHVTLYRWINRRKDKLEQLGLIFPLKIKKITKEKPLVRIEKGKIKKRGRPKGVAKDTLMLDEKQDQIIELLKSDIIEQPLVKTLECSQKQLYNWLTRRKSILEQHGIDFTLKSSSIKNLIKPNLRLDSEQDRIIKLLKKGVNKRAICKVLGCSKDALYLWLHRRNINF